VPALIRNKLSEINREAGIFAYHGAHKDHVTEYGDWTFKRKWTSNQGSVLSTIVRCPLAVRCNCKCEAKITVTPTSTSLFISGRHTGADHSSDKAVYLSHDQKRNIAKAIRVQPTLSAREVIAHSMEQPQAIDFKLRRSVSRKINRRVLSPSSHMRVLLMPTQACIRAAKMAAGEGATITEVKDKTGAGARRFVDHFVRGHHQVGTTADQAFIGPHPGPLFGAMDLDETLALYES